MLKRNLKNNEFAYHKSLLRFYKVFDEREESDSGKITSKRFKTQ